MEYLFQLNFVAIRIKAKISFREGPSTTRREHVEHFIETLDDRVVKWITILRRNWIEIIDLAQDPDDWLKSRRRMSREKRDDPESDRDTGRKIARSND